MRRWNLLIGSLSAAALIATAGAQTWDETTNGGGDAGDLPSTAQSVTGTFGAPLSSITASTSIVDDVDMFAIYISDPATFRAWTVSASDTQIWLFDSSGQAVWHNDDAPSGITPSLSPAPGGLNSFIGYGAPANSYYLSNATNTSAGTAGSASWPGGMTAGVYYIAVSLYNRDPRDSGGGTVIYSGAPFAGIHQSNPADPDRVVASWTGTVNTTAGPYTIYFEGAAFVPEPASMVVLGAGLAGLLGLRRRKK